MALVQARNNARAAVVGSLDLLSDATFDLTEAKTRTGRRCVLGSGGGGEVGALQSAGPWHSASLCWSCFLSWFCHAQQSSNFEQRRSGCPARSAC